MILSGQTRAAVAEECRDMGWGQFKPLLAETAVAALEPIQKRLHEFDGRSDLSRTAA